MKLITLLVLLTVTFFANAQDKLQIKDKVTNETIPFVKVIPEGKPSVLADIDGFFTLNLAEVNSFQLRSMGYLDTTIQVASLNYDLIIYLNADAKLLDEVNVLPGENPAHRIIDHAIANRKKNNPHANNSFQYDSYSKFYFTMDPKGLENIPKNTTDSSLIQLKNLFGSQYLFLLESSSIRQFIPPNKDKETITAYKVSGFTDPIFSTFANEMQSFSFYENQFELLGKSYINPIALGGTKRYLFLLEDTTIIGSDTTFMISFRPRKGKNFDGLKGQLFINTNGWAIEKVISEPNEPSESLTIKVVQEYAFIDGKKWFPTKLSSEMSMPTLKMNSKLDNSSIIGKGNTYISNILIDPPLNKRKFGSVAVETDEKAGEKSDKEWDSTRLYQLTDQERKTYQVIDSISKENHLEQKLMLLSTIADGKIPMGNLNLDLNRIINYNLYEGFRFGLGLETSKKLMKRATIGGYFGWATRDEAWKYGGFSEFKLYPKKELKLKLTYQQDLLTRGGDDFQLTDNSLSIKSLYRGFYIKNMERQRLAQIMFSGYVLPTVRVALIGNYQRIGFTEGYQFLLLPEGITTTINQYDIAETSIEIFWQLREKVMQLGNKRISMGSKYPKFALKVTKGIAGVFESSLDYLRLNLEISQEVSLRGFGKFSWMLTGSKTQGDVPLFLLHAGKATGGNWRLTVPNTFETMLPSTFFTDQQASLFTRVTFLAWKTKLKWFAPQLSIHHAVGYGSMKNSSYHSNRDTFKSMDKGYYEGGIIVDNLLMSGFVSLGMGLFDHYGYYANPDFSKNLTVKLSLNFKI